MNVTEFVYDPENSTMSYGVYRCHECGMMFYGGGQPLHKSGCSHKGMLQSNATYAYHFGDEEVKTIKDRIAKGCCEENALGELRMKVLEDQFPGLI